MLAFGKCYLKDVGQSEGEREREKERYDAEANHKRIRNLLFKIEILRTVLGFLMNKEILFLLDRVRFF